MTSQRSSRRIYEISQLQVRYKPALGHERSVRVLRSDVPIRWVRAGMLGPGISRFEVSSDAEPRSMAEQPYPISVVRMRTRSPHRRQLSDPVVEERALGQPGSPLLRS